MSETRILKGNIYNRYIPGIMPEPSEPQKKWWFIFNSGNLLIINNGGEIRIPFFENPSEIGVLTEFDHYLGTLDGYACYTAITDADTVKGEGFEFTEIRPLFNVLEDDLLLLACKAKHLAEWNRMSQFCGKCGTHNELKTDEQAKICPKCGLLTYPRISPAVITAIIKDDSILLASAYKFKKNIYSLIAGFVEPGETLEDAVQREIMEEVGIKVKNIQYFASQPWSFPDSLMVGFTAEYEAGDITVDGVEIRDAAWFKRGSLPELPDGMSIARKIIEWYKENY